MCPPVGVMLCWLSIVGGWLAVVRVQQEGMMRMTMSLAVILFLSEQMVAHPHVGAKFTVGDGVP